METALVFPFFLFLMLAVLQYTAVMEASVCCGAALAEAGRLEAMRAYDRASGADEGVQGVGGLVSGSHIRAAIGDRHAVKNLQVTGKPTASDANVLELRMTYQPQGMAGIYLPRITFLQKIRVRTWTGRDGIYHADGSVSAEMGGGTVYVAATGTVYHADLSCTHLKLSIREADTQTVGWLRNKSGEKYHACERCPVGEKGTVYITGEGNRYHSSLSCSGLKRTVEEVRQADCDLRPCKKCAGDGK